MDIDDQPNLGLDSVFTEPPRPPTPPPTLSVYHREPLIAESKDGPDWESVSIRLVGSHPLWGHHLWNAARAFASYLDQHQELVRGRCVLELGAGGALPSIVAVLDGARQVVVTDYPDADLVHNMEYNIAENVSEGHREKVSVQGYLWGSSVQPLLSSLPSPEDKFDTIILSDLVFNHSQHDALLTTCENAMSSGGCALVLYSHHIPKFAHKDMGFFDKARERGWACEEVLTRTFPPMFPEDSGDVDVRSTVHGWKLVPAGGVDSKGGQKNEGDLSKGIVRSVIPPSTSALLSPDLFDEYLVYHLTLHDDCEWRSASEAFPSVTPSKILEAILLRLEWVDLLQLRVTCKALHDASKLLSVWRAQFARLSDSYTVPFVPPRPLNSYTSQELEKLVIGWLQTEFIWSPGSILDHHTHRSIRQAEYEFPRIALVGGGRWFLSNVDADGGSVCASDLDTDPIKSKILIAGSQDSSIAEIYVDIDQSSPVMAFNLAISYIFC
ncbi:hypothetical protein ONZ45_g1094 [Pleurotus djamor]|nr:hypothetical protein ONZ45_g1094 [Pleurotus djamor]